MMNFAPMLFNVLAFKINAPDHMSVLTMGTNQQVDLFLSNKRNQGFGEDNGDLNQINLPVNYTVDTDFADGNSQKTSIL